MAKKKIEKISKSKNYVKREVKLKPTEWAKQKKIDAHLFLYWKNKLMSEREFNELNKKIRGEK